MMPLFLVVNWDGYYLTLGGVYSTEQKAQEHIAGIEERWRKDWTICPSTLDAPFDMETLVEGWR